MNPPRNVDYSTFLPCSPWARGADYCVKKPTVTRLPKVDGRRFVNLYMGGVLGHGLPDIPQLDPTSSRDRLCSLGRRNYKGLVRHFASRPTRARNYNRKVGRGKGTLIIKGLLRNLEADYEKDVSSASRWTLQRPLQCAVDRGYSAR